MREICFHTIKAFIKILHKTISQLLCLAILPPCWVVFYYNTILRNGQIKPKLKRCCRYLAYSGLDGLSALAASQCEQ